VSKFVRLIVAISFVFLALLPISCSNAETINEKISSQLLAQVNLKKEQIAELTPPR